MLTNYGALQYFYGKNFEKTCFSGIACPICGCPDIIFLGRVPLMGFRFKCQKCKNEFAVRLAIIRSDKKRRSLKTDYNAEG